MTPENRRRHCEEMMARAREELAAAEENLTILGRYNVATSRAYYAMFYAASGLLAARDKHRSKHSGVVSAFGEQFAKTGDMDPALHGIFKKAFRSRITCDYRAPYRETCEKAEASLADARAFLAAAEQRLKVEIDALEGRSGGAGERGGPDAEDA